MNSKKCTKCNGIKPTCDFTVDNSKRDNRRPECRKCQNKRELAQKRTKEGLIGRIYSAQCSRSKLKGFEHPEYSIPELRSWAFKKDIYHELFDEWVRSGYDKMKTPSIDRLDDYKSYTFNNIQIITWKENNEKGRNDRKNGINNKVSKAVIQMSLSGMLIANYYSIIQAARETGVNRSSISKCCLRSQRQAGGYYWMFDISP